MPKALSESQITQFREDGFLFPYQVYTPGEAASLYDKYSDLEQSLGEEPQNRFRIKAQLPFPWLCDVVRHPKLLDAVEDLIGPNILCWGSSLGFGRGRSSS